MSLIGGVLPITGNIVKINLPNLATIPTMKWATMKYGKFAARDRLSV
jgi:hypothetical protein